jgi:hypothetical protein
MHALDARKGDWIEVNTVGGGPSRRGQILEIVGSPGHERFRVRWDEQHESLHFPAQGTRVLHEGPDGTLGEGGEQR